MPEIVYPPDVATIALRALRYKLIEEMPTFASTLEIRDRPAWEYHLSAFIDRTYYELTGTVLAHQLDNQRIVREQVVRNDFRAIDGPFQRWKDRHKESWWLRWYVKWRPVRWLHEPFERTVRLTVEVEDLATFPKASISYPDKLGRPVMVRTVQDHIETRRDT